MRRSRRSMLAGGVGLSAAFVAACGASSSGGGEGAPQSSGPVIELRTHARAGSERDGYQKNVDAFNEQYAGKYHVTYEGITGNLYEGQETHMAGGTIGDIHYAHQSNIKMQEYAVKGAAVALDPFIAKDKNFKLTDWPQRAQEAMKIIDNKVFALPVRGQVAWLFLYWNRDMLQKNGVPEPTPNWTLDELVTQAKKLQQPGSTEFFPVGYSWG
ncbi:MAG: ABC transporter substrate-binding protein, partial [Chloroflexota bacterium]